MFKIIPSKKAKGLCVAYRCANKHTPKNRFCSKHNHRYQKWKNPIKYTFHQKKSRAKERGIKWNLTLAEFTQFCKENDYMNKKGRTASAASIDRIDPDPEIGYEVGNIQILSLAANSKKMHEDKADDDYF